MDYRPYEYQERATEWVIAHRRCGLFLDMGLGKTVITLTAVQRLMDYAEVERTLIVAPKKVAETTWTDEADKWTHLSGLRVAKVMGTPQQRVRALESSADIYVIGRDSFVWLVGHYNGRLPYDMMVIDELTTFKTPKSQRFKAMRMVTATVRRVVGLTGTPAPNGLVDLWAQMYCLDMGERLGRSVTRYRDTYFNQYRWNNIVVRCTPKAGCEDIIRNKVADICLTMRAVDYLQLPKLNTRTVMVRLDYDTRKRYERFERDRVLEFATEHEGDDGRVLANSVAALMGKLCQFANGAVYDSEGNAHHIHEAKTEALQELVEQAKSPVLVFYQYRHDIPRIKKALKKYQVQTYEGGNQLRDWNEGKIDVLLAHPASTAFGLNMQQGGHYAVWFGTGWNMELYQQANARLYRQGQRFPVMVYRLVVEGTPDVMATAAIDRKQGVQEALLEGLKTLTKKHKNNETNKSRTTS